MCIGAEIVSLERVRAGADLAEEFGVAPRSELYHSLIVHFENDQPVQLEDRYVSPRSRPVTSTWTSAIRRPMST